MVSQTFPLAEGRQASRAANMTAHLARRSLSSADPPFRDAAAAQLREAQ